VEVEFADDVLDRLETEIDFDGGYAREVVRAYRKVLGWLRLAQTSATSTT
jgi:hypothetical protein